MELKNFFAQDLQGNVIPSPTVYMYQPGTTTLVTGLKDKDGNALINPFTGTTNGQVVVAAPDGDYDMRVTGAGRDTTMRVRFIDSIAGSAEILRTDLASSATGKGGALVAFKQSGVGAAARTVLDELRATVRPEQFGAVGDGVADDTAAIVATLATGRPVYFSKPAVYYNVTAPVSINTPFTAGLYRVFGGSGAITFAAGTVKRVHPEWFGADPLGVADSKTAIELAIRSAYGNARLPVYFNGQYVVNSEIELSSVFGVRLVSDRFATLDGKNIDNFQGIIKILNCQDVVIDGLRFAGDSTNVASATQGGIEIDNESPAVATGSSYITVQNCVFDKLRTFNLYGRIGQGSAQYKWTFKDNRFYLAGYAGSAALPGIGGGIDIYSLFDIDTYTNNEVTVSGNTFYITDGYQGIAFKVHGARNSVVSNNFVVGGATVNYGSAYVEIYMKDSVFSNNVIQVTGTATNGLRIKGCINTVVSDCRVSTRIDVREAFELTTTAGVPLGSVSSRDVTLNNLQVDGFGTSVSTIRNANGLTINDCKFPIVSLGSTSAAFNVFQNVTVSDSLATQWSFEAAYPVTGTVNFTNTQGRFDNAYPSITSIPTSASTELSAALAATGTARFTPAATSSLSVFRVPPAGTRVSVLIVTSGTTSYTVRFTQGFGYVAPLSTGTTSGAVFVYDFISDGTVLNRVSSSNNTDLATLGAELITNGDFSSGTGWTVGTNWSIGGGVLTGATASASTFQAVAVNGSTYEITYTVTSYTSGDVRAVCGTNRGAYVRSTGTYKQRIIATGTEIGIIGSSFVGTIDNFSAKLVTY